MTQVTIAEVRSHLDQYLRLVRRGAVVRVMDGDTAVAEIVPIARPAKDRRRDVAVLDEMERRGLIRRGSGRVDDEILASDPPGAPTGVVQTLLAERDER